MEFLTPDKGIRIAQQRLPRIECEVAAHRDFPCSVDFAWQPGQPLGPIEYEPPLYWWVQADDEMIVCGYCLYHYQDTNHRHDFTGLAIIEDRRSGQRFTALRSHYDIVVHRVAKLDQVYRVEEGAHPIVLGRSRPGYSRWLPDWHLQESGCISDPNRAKSWGEIRKRFAPAVTLPIDWDDKYLYTYSDKYFQKWCRLFDDQRPRVTRGLLYQDPKSFLAAVIGLGRVV